MSLNGAARFAFNVAAVPLVVAQSVLVYVMVSLAVYVAVIPRPDFVFSLGVASALGAFAAVNLWYLFYNMHREWFKKHWRDLLRVFTFIKNLYDLFNDHFGSFFTAAFRR